MKTIYINEQNFVSSPYVRDASIPVEVSDEQFRLVSNIRFYHRWRYYPETGEVIEEPIMTPEMLRGRRNRECFSIIDNRSILWWNSLSEARKEELNA